VAVLTRTKAVIATATVAVGGGMFTLIDAATATNKGPAVEAADESVTLNFSLAPTSAVVAKCMPAATVRVRVRLLEEKTGRDVLQVDARGLRPNTAFTVFLVEEPNDPFGAVEYIGDLETNRQGRAKVELRAIVEEAFASTLVKGKRVRADLDHVGMWFADPAGDDACFGKGKGKVTPFDGDGNAGVQAFNSANLLPASALP
jgi:hypothetical protein